MYVPPAYEFPEKFFVHSVPGQQPIAVDAAGVPLPTQPVWGTKAVGGDEVGQLAVEMPDGTMYMPPPLYPPAGEPPEEWPPDDWGAEDEGAPNDTADENDAPDTVEAAADQGPDSGSADPAGVGDVADEDLRIATGTEMSGEGAVEEGELAAPTNDARVETEADAERPFDRDVSDLLTAGLVETTPEPDDSAFLEVPVGVDEVSIDPIPMPGEAMPVGGDEVSTDPIPMPGEAMPVGGDEVSATPITLPGQEMPVGGDEVSATPITLPGQEMPVGGDEVSATPITLPGQEMPVGGDEVSATPITLPGQEMPVGVMRCLRRRSRCRVRRCRWGVRGVCDADYFAD